MVSQTRSFAVAFFAFVLLAGARADDVREVTRVNTLHQGSGIDTGAISADRLADSMASVNTNTCETGTMFNPAKRTPADSAVLDILRAGIFRHVREDFGAGGCYNQTRYDAWWSSVSHDDHVGRIGSLGVGYTLDELTSLRERVPGLEAMEFANEWDVAAQPADGYLKLETAAKAGDRELNLGARNALAWTVPGQTYLLDQEGTQEQVTLSPDLPASISKADLSAPLRFDHPANASLRRVGDFVGDVKHWYETYVPVIHKQLPGLRILGMNTAHAVDNEAFVTDGFTLGPYIDLLDSHPYPIAGENPEGADGDGYRDAVSVDRSPCSYDHSSYSFVFNVACEGGRQAGAGYGDLATWITEYSYQTVPVGAAHVETWKKAIPDDVAVDYLAASEFFAATHGVTRLYWFQIEDGTSGPHSGFCPYGLIRDDACSPAYGPAIEPKPEFLTLMSLIAYFTDPACQYPQCGAHTQPIAATWKPASLPLDTVNVRFGDGRTAIVFWLGSKSYDADSSDACSATTSCYVNVAPRRETLSSPLFSGRHVYLAAIDDDAHDRLPPKASISPRDGMGPVSIRACPHEPARTAMFGCIEPLRELHPKNGAVEVQASRRLQWIVVAKR